LASGAGRSFAQLAGQLSGPIVVAIEPLGDGDGQVFGDDVASDAGTSMMLPVLVQVMRVRGGSGLSPIEQQWARAAITRSAVRPGFSLYRDLERLAGNPERASNGVQSVLRASGDDQTMVAGASGTSATASSGQNLWAPGESAKFLQALGRGCLLPQAQSAYVLNLMEHIRPSERWGLGSADFTVPVAFQNGWAPQADGAYVVRQSGIIDAGSSRGVAVSIVASAGGTGTMSLVAGMAMVTEAANWLRSVLVLAPRPAASCTG
jgi:hypothetical protein